MKKLLLMAALLLAGCGPAAEASREARSNYRQSTAAYKACLAANPDNGAIACQNQKLAMDADGRAFDSLSRVGSAGGIQTYNVLYTRY